MFSLTLLIAYEFVIAAEANFRISGAIPKLRSIIFKTFKVNNMINSNFAIFMGQVQRKSK